MNFKNQLSIIETLVQGSEVDMRTDCPFCSHSNTLTIKKSNGKLLWYCFHASCDTKGHVTKELSMEEVKAKLLSSVLSSSKKKFIIPKSFISVY